MKKEKWITGIICGIFLMVAAVFYIRSQYGQSLSGKAGTEWTEIAASGNGKDAEGQTEEVQQAGGKETAGCTVYICGQVRNPGVYALEADARVCDAVEAAGGLTKKADAEAMNQARLLTDGEQITIPARSRNRKKQSSEPAGEEAGADGRININQASKEELMTLTGIGEAKAQMILQYRTENGSFQKPEDIMNISGIKEGVYRQIKDKITV